MSWQEIAKNMIAFMTAEEQTLRDTLQQAGLTERAAPWVDLGFVGASYLKQLLASDGDHETTQRILSQSPRDIWAKAHDVEKEVAILFEMQLARADDRRDP